MRAATVKLWALHLVGDALIVALFYVWLSIGEASAWQLIETALLGLVLAGFAVWLQGTAFAHFQEPESALAASFRSAWRRLLPLVVAALIAGVVYWFLSFLTDRAESPANKTASWLTLHLRRPVHPPMILSVFTWAIRLLEWVVAPVLLLPLAARVASEGWQGLAHGWFIRLRDWRYWLLSPVLLVLALYVPWRLFHWVPYLGGLSGELASFIARWLIAWLLFVAAWFATVAVASRRVLLNPGRAKQP